MSGPQVLVVGGGLAGVAAAAALRAAGCGVQVIEREAAPGGRGRGSERDGFRLDAAPFLVSARERRLSSLIGEAGLAGRLLPLRPVTIAQLRGGRVEETPPAGRPVEVARSGGVRLVEGLRLRRLARLERRFRDLLDAERPELAVRLDDRSAADFVRLYFGTSVWERWAEPQLASDLLADPVEASRVCLLLARAARGEAPLATLRGSPAAIAEALWSGADLLGGEATALAREGQRLALAVRGRGALHADAVVLALPARATERLAGDLLAPAEHDGLAAARSAPAIVLHAALERSPTRKATRLRVPSAEGLPIVSVAVEPGGSGAPAPPGAALLAAVATPAWSRAHLQAADGVVEKELLGALERIFPGVASALRFRQLVRYEEALPRFDVGRYRALAKLRAVQADLREHGRRLYFAGDHWVAPTLEGAIASGLRAAVELCEDFGLERTRSSNAQLQ
jgi:oxygen-dependent protoporphyrinogen oxidase